ncbi:serine/threonine-protein kinase [Micromonospora sp. SH-82]|uniref:serine/threonine-protein kinase n=1 Tax=Micromonospora sp. SH-82 TaxID=3132938 RepID=UPI003EC155C6
MARRTLVNGRYELLERPTEQGAMGEVWFGVDTRLERQVVVKFIRFFAGDPKAEDDYTRRFVRESRITARLEHPGVPAVYDVGTHKGRPFLVMQRIQGVSLRTLLLEQGRLPVGWVAVVAAQVCAVLSEAHRVSLVHRDLKPGNLMLEPEGTVKVLDFGLAVAPASSDFSRVTMTGHLLGTPEYMAPERIEANVSGPESDIYALGCTVYELLTGKRPFAGATPFDVMNKQVRDEPPLLRTVRPEVPVGLEALVLEMLRKRPEERLSDADVVHQLLLPFVDDLQPIPGVVELSTTTSAVRLYARVVSRILAAAPRAVTAGNLRDGHVLTLRSEQADAFFADGDYRQAAAVYRLLADDVAARHGPLSERALNYRSRVVTCHALLGLTDQMSEELAALIDDHTKVFGAADHRTVQLRRQLGLRRMGRVGPDGVTVGRTDFPVDLPRRQATEATDLTAFANLRKPFRLNRPS